MSGIKFVAASAFLATADSVVSIPYISEVSRLGIVGILVLAIIALWQNAGKREAQADKREDELKALIRETAEALKGVEEAHREATAMRRQMTESMNHFAVVIEKCRGVNQ